MKIAVTVAGLALLFLSSARAETPMTGSALLKLCEGNTAQKAACESYLHGVSDTLDFIAGAAPAAGLMEKCVPEGITMGKLRSVMTKMLHRKGIHRDAPAASLAMTAFSAAWRCNPNGQYHNAEEELGKAIR
jgi:hypothetical protein